MSEYKFKIGGRDYSVAIESIEGASAKVTVNGKAYDVELDAPVATAPAAPKAKIEAKPETASAETAPKAPAQSSTGTRTVNSPLPGVIIDICVKEGQAVRRGEKVAVLEAMKMENDILAPQDGTVKDILAKKGDSVLEGAPIVSIG